MSLEDVARRYAVAVSPTLLALVDPADPNDPIARQFLPSLEELNTLPEELRRSHRRCTRIRRCPASSIAIPTACCSRWSPACPVYCRFCFRREMIGPGKDNALSPADFEAALAYIADHPEIWEVILTGGDPFILSPRRIAEITSRLGEIAHVKVVRWHTRVPVTDPAASPTIWWRRCRRPAPPPLSPFTPIIRANFRPKRAAPSRAWRKPRFRWSASRCC